MKIKRHIIAVLLIGSCLSGYAQLNPMGMQYFQNQYLGNPAMAGIEEGLHLNAGYSQLWSIIPGSPSSQVVTLDNRTNKVGLGLSFYNDQAGLLKQTRVMATYAYHLPLNANNDQLHFGVSLGILSERLSNEDINGEPVDISAVRFNERDAVLDGDFGIAYTTGRLTLQGTIPNLKHFLDKERYNTADWSTFFTALSYKFYPGTSQNDLVIEPKVVYRGVRAYDDVFDVGVNVGFSANKLHLMGMYHSTESVTGGIGLDYKALSILALYTSNTAALRTYANGVFEIGLGYHFKRTQTP